MKRLALIAIGVAALASFNVTAQTPTAALRRPRRRSPRTSRRSCTASARTATGPAKWRRCRCCRTRTRGRGPRRSRPRSCRARCRRGARTCRRRCRCATTSACRRRRSTRLPRGSMAAPPGATPRTCRRRRSSRPGGPPAPSPTWSSRCRSSSSIPAEGELGVQMFYSKVPWTEDKFAEIVELKPSNRAVLHHAGIYFVDIPEGASHRRRPHRRQGRQGDRRSRLARLAVDRQRPAGIEQAAVVGAGPRPRSSSRRHRQAPAGRQVHQLADALQPDRQAGEGSHAARHLVQQGAGDARSADSPGGRSARDHQGRVVDLSRRRPRDRIQGGPEQHAPQPHARRTFRRTRRTGA